MANFATHIGVGAVVSGALATLTLAADVIAPENLVAVTLAGVLGSVLPDIDLKDSRPSRALFSGLAVFFAFAVLFNFATKYSIVEMWLLLCGTFVLVRYGGEALFHRLSYHRGIFHSVLAAVTFGVLTAVVFKHILGRHEGVAWLAGGFVFIGAITHLVLDELYSVDVFDRRLKASFGTALKLIDRRELGQSAAMAVVCALALSIAPPTTTFVNGITSQQLWTGLRERMLPRDHWFGIEALGRLAQQAEPADRATAPVVGTAPASAAPQGAITTGSLPEQSASPPTAAAAE